MYLYDSIALILEIMLMAIAIVMIYYYMLISKKKSQESIKRDTVNFFFKDSINYEKVIIDKRKNLLSENDKSVLEILSVFEKLAISVKNRVFDKEVLLEYYGKYMIHFYKEFRFFILKRREESGNPYLFIEYEKLVNQIQSDLKFNNQNYYE